MRLKLTPKSILWLVWLVIYVAIAFQGVKFLNLARENLDARTELTLEVGRAFEGDKALAGPGLPVIERAHHQGNSLATTLMMQAAVNKGEILRRDEIFLEGVRLNGNSELVHLLNQGAPYNPASRDKMLNGDVNVKGGESSLAQESLAAVTTLSVAQQQEIGACKAGLDQRYSGTFGELNYLTDLALTTKTCVFKTL